MKLSKNFYIKLGIINTLLCFVLILVLELKIGYGEDSILGNIIIDALVFPLVTGVSSVYAIINEDQIPEWLVFATKFGIIFLFFIFSCFIPYKLLTGM